MALAFAHHAAPQYAKPLAVAAVLAMAVVNYFGIRKTAWLTRIIVTVVLAALAVVVFATLGSGNAEIARLQPTGGIGLHGVLQSAGLWFFAFAGYARLATLGEEVADPGRTLPRAIPIALGITLVVYASVALAALLTVDIEVLARSPTPLVTALDAADMARWAPVVRVGAAIACLGVLLSLVAGVARTSFAMAAQGDLPRALAAVHPRYRVPHRAELAVGVVVAAFVAFADVVSAIGLSAFTVLVYYAVTNASAWTLEASQRRWPRWTAAAGVAGCLLLALMLPAKSVLAGGTVLVAGALVFAVQHRRRAGRAET
jgi:APA family basic amino acid/polyamine antiporter